MASKRYSPLSKSITAKKLELIAELAEKGMNRTAIVRTMGLEHNAFNKYKETGDAFLSGRDVLADTTAKQIIRACSTSHMDRKLLAEKLSLFTEPFDLKKPITDPETAKAAVGEVIEKYCQGLISEVTMLNVTRAAGLFVEIDSQTVLRREVDEIKALLKKRGMKR